MLGRLRKKTAAAASSLNRTTGNDERIMGQRTIQIGLADPEETFREGATWALRRAGARVVAEASTLEGLVSVSRGEDLDVVLIDEWLCEGCAVIPFSPFVVVARHPSMRGLDRVLARAASARVARGIDANDLAAVVVDVAFGRLQPLGRDRSPFSS